MAKVRGRKLSVKKHKLPGWQSATTIMRKLQGKQHKMPRRFVRP
jgi:hypothetical protein